MPKFIQIATATSYDSQDNESDHLYGLDSAGNVWIYAEQYEWSNGVTRATGKRGWRKLEMEECPPNIGC